MIGQKQNGAEPPAQAGADGGGGGGCGSGSTDGREPTRSAPPARTCRLSTRSVLLPTSTMMTSLPRSARTSSTHRWMLRKDWRPAASVAWGGTAERSQPQTLHHSSQNHSTTVCLPRDQAHPEQPIGCRTPASTASLPGGPPGQHSYRHRQLRRSLVTSYTTTATEESRM